MRRRECSTHSAEGTCTGIVVLFSLAVLAHWALAPHPALALWYLPSIALAAWQGSTRQTAWTVSLATLACYIALTGGAPLSFGESAWEELTIDVACFVVLGSFLRVVRRGLGHDLHATRWDLATGLPKAPIFDEALRRWLRGEEGRDRELIVVTVSLEPRATADSWGRLGTRERALQQLAHELSEGIASDDLLARTDPSVLSLILRPGGRARARSVGKLLLRLVERASASHGCFNEAAISLLMVDDRSFPAGDAELGRARSLLSLRARSAKLGTAMMASYEAGTPELLSDIECITLLRSRRTRLDQSLPGQQAGKLIWPATSALSFPPGS